ncbi:MAG: SDR family NAD(P)-dependent oxidoreductase [Anaerolineae bacterium]|jgi:2-deoxy-D-gluconate 3-dehydrogenase
MNRTYLETLFALSGKTALVTGGSTGLGRGMAEALIGAGARVAIVGRSKRVFDTAEEIGAIPLQADLADREQAQALVGQAVEALGELDILVNNAGVQIRHPAEVFPLEDWDRVLEVNLNAVWILAQAAGRHMLAQGHGKIINVASALSFVGGITIPAYAASKGGVAQLTKALSNEWAGRGVNVNAVAPGYMNTEMCAALVGNPDREPMILTRVPAGRWGLPDDLKGVVLFLASAAADYVHGAIIPVDGGFLGR